MKTHHEKTRVVSVGKLKLGAGHPIRVQTMTNISPRRIKETLVEIEKFAKLGCEIIRVAVPDEAAAKAIAKIKKVSSLPIVADIHFDYRLALLALESGVDKLRLNPGNIGSVTKVREVARLARRNKAPLRIGVNAGSLEDVKVGKSWPERMVASVMKQVRILENCNFYDLVISAKANNAVDTIETYRLLAKKLDYPLHLGVTEAGSEKTGSIKSAVALGALLAEGIGDTI